MKDGDIFKWRYNKHRLKELNDGNNGGTTYWCCSNIAIWDDAAGILKDTYWGSSYDGWCFDKKQIDEWLVIEFVANINDLEPVNHPCVFNNYDDSDCVNISHKNMFRGGFYIKKDARQSIEKKKEFIRCEIKEHERKANQHLRDAEYLSERLSRLTNEDYV